MKPNSKQYPDEKFNLSCEKTQYQAGKKKKKSFPQKNNTQLKNQIFSNKNKILKYILKKKTIFSITGVPEVQIGPGVCEFYILYMHRESERDRESGTEASDR
jgi:hypothetical protein